MCICSLTWEAPRNPQEISQGFPGCPPLRSKSNSTNDDCGVGKAAAVKKCHRLKRKKKGSRCWRCWGRKLSRSIHVVFLGEKRHEGLIKLLEHVGRMQEWHVKYDWMTTRLDWILVKWTLWDAIPTSFFSNSKVGLGIASDWDDWDPDWNLSTS